MVNVFRLGSIYQGRLNKGDELVSSLTDFLKSNNIKAGLINGIGALTSAKLGFYNSIEKKYEDIELNEGLEIVSLSGNVTLKGGEIFPHIHVVLSRADFSTLGGHLFAPSKIFAFEFEIFEFVGETFKRAYDEDTGLFLLSK
ncbi:MAG: DNA-binding protein [Thermodesulfovibrionales bacterium]|nr:DNA-binding protein [Thermodesulfovibrionales bacterium]